LGVSCFFFLGGATVLWGGAGLAFAGGGGDEAGRGKGGEAGGGIEVVVHGEAGSASRREVL
jgi:hypothetical protein